MKDRKIGEIFQYGSVRLQVVEGAPCKDCYFSHPFTCLGKKNKTGRCSCGFRADRKNVIFKKL